jgi:putative Mn2+ efflux pump MntP
VIGNAADYIVAGLLVAVGLLVLRESRGEEHEGDRLLAMTQAGLLGAIALGVSISLDELAIGFGAGLLRLPTLALVISIGAQAFLVTQVGVRLGGRVGERWRESAGRVAGAALIALGTALLTMRLAG